MDGKFKGDLKIKRAGSLFLEVRRANFYIKKLTLVLD